MTDKYDYHTRFNECKTIWEKQNLYREYYQDHHSDIIAYCKSNRKGMYNTYAIDWVSSFTPIEHMAWQVIRAKGIAMYPQYPVLNYMLDFGNPVIKIGLELDGRDYHDPKKDFKRDQEIFDKTGWKIFRISGSDAVKIADEDVNYEATAEDQEYEKHWFLNDSLEGLIECLHRVYFSDNNTENGEYWRCVSVLDKRRLAVFPI